MGTPDFAVPTLLSLLNSHHNVSGVVTAPDKPAGRGLQLRMSAVKICALQNNLKIFQPENLEDPIFLNEIEKLRPDVAIVIAFRKLPRKLWTIPEKGTFNLHASLLPQYRGAAPINWAIINGETETGLTTFFINDGIDSGHIIFSHPVSISEDDTFGTLYHKMSIIGADVVMKTLEAIEQGTVCAVSQEEIIDRYQLKDLKKAPKIFREDCKIDWKKTALQIRNHIRGLSPVPAAFSVLSNLDGKTLSIKIFDGMINTAVCMLRPGEVIYSKHTMIVGTGDGMSIEISEIQPESKPRMKVSDFRNGLQVLDGWFFE